MLVLTGTLRLPPENRDAFRPVMDAMLSASRAEPGCISYAYAWDVQDEGLVHVAERWRDRAALDEHFGTPHLAKWREEGARLGTYDRNLTIFEVVGEGERL